MNELRDKLTEILMRSTLLNAEHVKIEVQGSVVTLHGEVEFRREKSAAANEIQYIDGVTEVHNKLAVRRPFDNLLPSAKKDDEKQLVDNRTGLI